jgi:predicted metalloprotease
MRRPLVCVAMAACTVLMLVSCTKTLDGTAVSVFADPFKVGGLQAVDGPSELRPDAARNSRTIENSDGGEIDTIAGQAVTDIEEFWSDSYRQAFEGSFRRVNALMSWDASDYDGTFCGDETHGLVNAAFCVDDNTIGWDRGELMPSLRDAHGDMAIAMVLAHEYGHAIQKMAGLVNDDTPALVGEQQADCLAGVYMRWVAEGNSPRFTLSTGDGLNNLLAGMISFRDPLMTANEMDLIGNPHGSAFERISAFQFGFTDGPSACTAIDEDEITQRRGDLPVELQQDESGEWPVGEESVRAIVDAMNILFSPANPPQLSFDAGAASSCTDARPSPPVSYCPASNTIAVDLPALEKMGASTEGGDPTLLLSGDNTAYSVLMSRYMLAIQHAEGLVLDNAEAALRTACLTGVATTMLAKTITTPEGQTVALAAGDLDEAVSGLLTNGLVASDVNGESVPAGFARIDAFRSGVLGDEARCLKRFP